MDEPTSRRDPPGRDEVLAAMETGNAERQTTIVVVIRDNEVGAAGPGGDDPRRAGRRRGRDGQDFAVVAGDGTVQLPPEVLGNYPPGTPFPMRHVDGEVTLVPSSA